MLPEESAELGEYKEGVDATLDSLAADNIVRRIWVHDFSVWETDPTEVSNRLDWLHTPEIMLDNLHRFDELVRDVRSAGYTQAVLMGMGGSSLASKVLCKVLGKKEGYLDLTVVDDIAPETILAVYERLDLEKTLFIVSSKSGGTIETLSLLKFFYGRALEALGREKVGEHFIVISDPGSELASVADKFGFRGKVLNDPNIGGRYSALSYDGLVPVAMIGVDLPRLLTEAKTAATECESNDPRDNPGVWLGAVLGELANRGRDKVVLVISPKISGFGDWAEQLVAESTGKQGRGILPVLVEHLGAPASYGNDQVFVYIALDGDALPRDEAKLDALSGMGHPVLRLRLHDAYGVGREMFLWEMAVAVAGHIIGINPFDQPNVESSKVSARKMIAQYESTRKLPFPEPRLISNGITVYGDVEGGDVGEMLVNFLGQVEPGAYIGIHAYVQPTALIDSRLQELRERMRTEFRVATTVGYGPRFLHSTGQLHKGDAGKGVFLQIIAEDGPDVPIPDKLGAPEASVTFGVLMRAQALGDRQALLDRKRKVISLTVKGDIPKALNYVAVALDGIFVPAR